VIAPGLRVLFCGINPGLVSAATGHHFARPGNRFWPALHRAGFTDRLLSPGEQELLLGYRLGVTNLVDRGTAGAAELADAELRAGAAVLEAKLRRFRPGWFAMLGVGAFRVGFGRRDAVVGPQAEPIAGVRAWVLPNPSGLNAHYQLPDLVREFSRLHEAAS
jgi:TDG/mug DNA glycosylase family protein